MTVNCSSGCSADCPPYVGACPLGLGVDGTVTVCSSLGACKQASGQCACHAGYTGNACNECLGDYIRIVSHGRCIYMPGSQVSCSDGVKDGNEVDVDCGGPNCAPCAISSASGAIPAGMITGISSGCISLLLLSAIIIWWRRRHLKIASAPSPSHVRRRSLVNSKAVVVASQKLPGQSYQSVLPVPHDGGVDWE